MKKERFTDFLLRKLELKDATDFLLLHSYPTVYGSYFDNLYVPGEPASNFIQRLLWLTKCSYTIRLKSDPDHLIGTGLIYRDYDHGKAHFLGGTVLPIYRHKTFLLNTFEQIRELARYGYGLTDLKIGETKQVSDSLFIQSPGILIAS